MKLLYLHIKQAGRQYILNDFKYDFSRGKREADRVDPICMVGENGSGKSQLLEVLAEIFYYLDGYYNTSAIKKNRETELYFRLDYEILIGDQPTRIRVGRETKKPGMFIVREDDTLEEVKDPKVCESYLPANVVGYTSGENETLSIPFLETYAEYASHVAGLALKKSEVDYDAVPDTRLVFTNYSSNISILVANFLLRSDEELALFQKEISLQKLRSFRIIIQLAAKGTPGKEIQRTPELQSIIDRLIKCATTYDLEPREKIYTLDYWVDDAMIEAFRHHFDSAFALYNALYKLELLNQLMIPKQVRTRIKKVRKEQHMVVKAPEPPDDSKVFRFDNVKLELDYANQPVDYIGLSDGQHQFVHIFGTLMMIDQPRILFLLDEPETHFNPQWRSKFISNLNRIARGRRQEMLITTHSPFILSDSYRENILIFKRDGQQVQVRRPEITTYGTSIEKLLKEAFNVYPPISKQSLEEIQELQKSSDLELLEAKVEEFGDSIEKFYLYDRIEELKEEHAAKG